jgi:hypothetical protein
MSTKECRKNCDVYQDWLKAGEMITALQDRITELEKERDKSRQAWVLLQALTECPADMLLEDWFRQKVIKCGNLEKVIDDADNNEVLDYFKQAAVDKEQIADLEAQLAEIMTPTAKLLILRARVSELTAQLKDERWVSVEDRLPKQLDDRVLIFVDGVVSEGFYMPETDEWFYVLTLGILHSSGRVDAVTHWKPITLPAPAHITDVSKMDSEPGKGDAADKEVGIEMSDKEHDEFWAASAKRCKCPKCGEMRTETEANDNECSRCESEKNNE